MERDPERPRTSRLDDLEARIARIETVLVDRVLPALDAIPFRRTAAVEPWLPPIRTSSAPAPAPAAETATAGAPAVPSASAPAAPSASAPSASAPSVGAPSVGVPPVGIRSVAVPPAAVPSAVVGGPTAASDAASPPRPSRNAPGLASPNPSSEPTVRAPDRHDADAAAADDVDDTSGRAPARRVGPAPSRRAPAPPPPAAPPPRRDLERFVGVAVLGRLGIGALLLAAGYFAQWTYVQIPPVGRVSLIYALAGLLVGASALLRHRVAPTFVGILWGGGTAVAYLAGVAARLRYDLVDPTTALAMLLGASLLGDALARKARLEGVALVAISGAVVAPLLVGDTSDHRTALLVYLLAVFAWGMFVGRRRGWWMTGAVAFVGNVAVAAAWFRTHGRVDLSTYLHVHAYLVGWSLPFALASLKRPQALRPFVALAGVALLVAELALAVASSAGHDALARWFPPVAGAGWAAAALLLRGAAGPDGTLHRWFARVGGALLVFGAFSLWIHRQDAWLADHGPLLASLVVAGLALLGRRRLGVGDGIAFAAAFVVTASTGLGGLADEFRWRLVAVATSALLVGFGSTSAWRVAGFVVAAMGAAVSVPPLDDVGWPFVGGFATAAAVSALGFLRAATLPAPRGDHELEGSAAMLVLAATLTWLLRVFGTPWGVIDAAVLNPGTVAAAVLLLTSVGFAVLPTGGVPRSPLARGVLLFSALVLVLAGVGREVHHATAALAAADLGRALDTLAFLGLAGLLAIVAGRRGTVTPAVGAALAWLVTALQVFATVRTPGGGFTAALQVLAVAAPPYLFLGSRRDARADAGVRAEALAIAGLLASLSAWVLAWSAGRFAGSDILVNPRFVTGALLVAGLAGSRVRDPFARHLVAVLASLLSVVVAIPEVLEATRGIDELATRRALVSVYVALHSSAILVVGFRRRSRVLRWLALLGFGAVVVKVGLFDLTSVSTPVRVLVTGCLGAILLAAAGTYARRARDATPPRPDGATDGDTDDVGPDDRAPVAPAAPDPASPRDAASPFPGREARPPTAPDERGAGLASPDDGRGDPGPRA